MYEGPPRELILLSPTIQLVWGHFIEFFRGALEGATTLLHFAKCSRPCLESVKAPFLTIRVANPGEGTTSSTAWTLERIKPDKRKRSFLENRANKSAQIGCSSIRGQSLRCFHGVARVFWEQKCTPGARPSPIKPWMTDNISLRWTHGSLYWTVLGAGNWNRTIWGRRDFIWVSDYLGVQVWPVKMARFVLLAFFVFSPVILSFLCQNVANLTTRNIGQLGVPHCRRRSPHVKQWDFRGPNVLFVLFGDKLGESDRKFPSWKSWISWWILFHHNNVNQSPKSTTDLKDGVCLRFYDCSSRGEPWAGKSCFSNRALVKAKLMAPKRLKNGIFEVSIMVSTKALLLKHC